MKIVDVKKLDDGVNGITIEGKIIKTPGNPRDSQYGWSQMVVLKDDTGEMSSWINIESAEDAYKVGQYIKVQGKVSKYVKGGKPGISLNNGKVIDEIIRRGDGEEYEEEKDKEESVKIKDVSQEKQKPMEKTGEKPMEKEYTNNDYWHDKTLREIENNKCIVRECAIKASTELMVAKYINEEADFFELADKIVDYIYDKKITSEAITKEFGGTLEPLQKVFDKLPESYQKQLGAVEKDKEQKIAKARELVRNPHLSEPVDDTMATVKQKKQVYGYIDEEGKKIGGIVDSDYITKEEVDNIGKPENLTKARAFKMWGYWFGNDGTMGERDKRELEAQEKEGSPFITEKEPIEKVDKNDDSSLTKDLLIEKINKLRKENALEDDAKFTKELGCNAKFNLWTEKELTKLKEKLEIWKPNWVTE